MNDYLPAQLRPKTEVLGGKNIWTLLTRDVSNVRVHSARDPDVSPQQRSYSVKAGIDIDGAPHGGVIQTGLSQPFMFLLSDHGDAHDSESIQNMSDIKSICDHVPSDRWLHGTIRGAFHFTFSDTGALLKSGIVRGVLRMLGKLRIDAHRQLAVATYCENGFLDAHLEGTDGSRLGIASPLHPQIEVLK